MKLITRTKEFVEVKHTDIFCDSCKRKIEIADDDAFECEIRLRTGKIDRFEGIMAEEQSVDLCPICADILFNQVFIVRGMNIQKTDV